jgi:putative transposase
MVKLVRAGSSVRSVARQFCVGLSHVQYWVRRAGAQRLDRVDWTDQSSAPLQSANSTSKAMEEAVLKARAQLRVSDLGEWGARAIHAHLTAAATVTDAGLPSVRTIGRVLSRRGVLDGKIRIRRTPPPPGWYLPLLAAGQAELDSFDIVEGLALAGGIEVEVFNGMSLHGGLVGSWPQGRFTSQIVMASLSEHWQEHGLPHYVQFDNAPLFQGAISYADTLGRVVRLCLQLGLTPVFAPPRETGFQAAIESYNARWQAKVWQRFIHPDMPALYRRSQAYVAACQLKLTQRIAKASALRRPWPATFHFDPKAALEGTVIFLRRSDEEGRVTVMGRSYKIDPQWQHRLVRAEVNFITQQMQFYGLRRAAPSSQPLLLSQPYSKPPKQRPALRAVPDGATRGRRLDSKQSKPSMPKPN